ncbi:MAG: Gfo/Idh/MocA family oxidoreductase [Eubacteriales bacterium]
MKKVITYGSFDLFHEGHYNLLKRAKELGDYLIVGITTEHYDLSRGKMNIVDPLLKRVENVNNTGFVDEIIIEDHVGQKIEDIERYEIDIFTVGSDWTGVFDHLKRYCDVVYLERTKGISSTQIRNDKQNIIKLGMIGCGRIAKRFVPEAKYVSGINVEAIYHPREERAQEFKERFNLLYATSQFEEFLNQIDAVYIASPHETHYEYTKEALKRGKHVLCEKPMVFTKCEAEELFALAKEQNVILLEGIKTAYAPGFIRLMAIAKSGVIGTIKDVEATFTRLTNTNTREYTDMILGGSFTEFASYTLLAMVKLLGTEYRDITFDSFNEENGIDYYTKATLRTATAIGTSKTGLGVKSEGELIIAGTKGYIKVRAPWWKTEYFTVCYENMKDNEEYFVKFQGEGLRYELSTFVSLIGGVNKSGGLVTRGESIALAGIMEEFLAVRSTNY